MEGCQVKSVIKILPFYVVERIKRGKKTNIPRT